LVKIDVANGFRPFSVTSALNGIVRDSTYAIKQGDKDDWRYALTYLENMPLKDFKRLSVPTMDAGLLKMHADPRFLLPRMSRQIDDMYGTNTIFYDYGKD
jgi:hypothetical protein